MTAKPRPPASRGKPPASSRPGDPAFYRDDACCANECIGHLLRQLRIRVDRAIDAELAEHDVTGSSRARCR